MTSEIVPIAPETEVLPLEISAIPPVSPAVAYLESLGSAVSKRTMISPLNRAACILNPALSGKDAWQAIPWQRLTAPVVRAVMAKVEGSPATRNKLLAALKGVARCAWEMRLLDTDELMRMQSIKGDAGSREVAGRFVPAGELFALLKVCAEDPSPAGARDAAMLTLAASTGARRAEIASLLLENVQSPEPGRFHIRVIGKRNKERMLYVTGNAGLALSDWLALRSATNCTRKATACSAINCTQDRLFCAIRKGGAIQTDQSVSTTALDKTLEKRAQQAGVCDLDWHDLRRTTASNLLDAGADISTVAGILGHSSVNTTARYDRRGERARIKASELLSVPYFARTV